MAVVLDATGTELVVAGSNTSGNYTLITVGSGSNRALIITCLFEGWTTQPASITATWDNGGTNQAMTQLSTALDTTNKAFAVIYGLRNPTSGNKTLRFTWTNTADLHAIALSFTGVDQTSDATAFPNTHNNSGNTALSTNTLPSASGNMSVEMTLQVSGAAATCSHIQVANDQGTASDNFYVQRGAASGSSIVLTWSWSGATPWVTTAVDIGQVSAGPPSLSPPLTVPVSRVVNKFKPWFRQRLFNHALPVALNAYTLTAETGTLTLAGQTATLTKVAATPGTQLDPAKTSANITLSNVNRTATRTGGTPFYATTLSNKSGVTGELYVEVATTAVADSAIGVSNAMIPDSDSGGTTNWMGWNTNSIGLYRQDIYYGGSVVGALPTMFNTNDVIGVYVDRPAAQIWFRNVTKNEAWWPTGPGFDISALGSGALYFGFTLSGTDSKTVNFDGVFLDTAIVSPTTRWDGSPIAGSPYTLTAETGTLTASGQAVALRAARKVAAGLGTVTLAGQAAALRNARKTAAGLGTLTLSGQTVVPRVTAPVTNGTLTLGGQTAALRIARKIAAGQGTLTLAGQPVTFRNTRAMPAGQGTLTLSGQNVTLRYSRKMPAGLGTLTLAGQIVNLIYSGSGSKLLPASAGQLTLVGQPVALRYAHKMPAASGTITLAGQIAALQRARKMTVTVGGIVLEGKAVSLVYGEQAGYTLTAASGVISLTGCDVTLSITRRPPTTRQETLKFGRPVYVSRW